MLFTFYEASSQSSSLTMGARSMAMGNASSCLKDEWAIYNNVAGLSGLNTTGAAFTYQSYPDFTSFDRMAVTIVAPVKFGVMALGGYRFGNDLYNEHILSAAYSNKFGMASLGIKLNYLQYQAEGFGTSNAFTVSFGGIAEITKALWVGAYVNNINQPTLSDVTEEKLPTYLTLGIGFTISEKVFAITEVEKDLDHELIIRAGLEYKLNNKFFARTGMNLNPSSAFGGFGFVHKKFIFDYAFQYHRELTAGHQASVTWKFKKSK